MTEPIAPSTDQFTASQPPARASWRPDLVRAHGAWIYLVASIAAGALVVGSGPVEPAMLVGTGIAGVFLVIAAIDAGPRRKLRQLLLGAALAIFAPSVALIAGADSRFLGVGVIALLLACSVPLLARSFSVLSPITLLVGVGVITLSAPVTALATGASFAQAGVLFGLLWVFFSWRTLQLASSLPPTSSWNRTQLRSQGLREAAIAAAWSLAVAMGLRIL